MGPADLEYIQNMNLLSQLRIGDLLHLGPDLATERVNKNAEGEECPNALICNVLKSFWTSDGLALDLAARPPKVV